MKVVGMNVMLKRPKHWKAGGISSGSEWDVFADGRLAGHVYETGQGWAWYMDSGYYGGRGWGALDTMKDAVGELVSRWKEITWKPT